MEELHRLLNSQNKSGFQVEVEKKIKDLSGKKPADPQSHNSEVDSLIAIIKQGESLLPKFTYQAFLRSLDESKIKIITPKPSFKFTRKTKEESVQKETVVQSELTNNEQTWQYRDARDEDKEVFSDENRVGLTKLENCTVKVTGSPAAACFTDLTDTVVVAPGIGGSVHITNCKNCRFLLGCKQLRIHETFDTDFYVIIASGPIIEDCDRVRFAPGGDNPGPWDQVKDFKWLKSERSPHWAVVPEQERTFPEFGKHIK